MTDKTPRMTAAEYLESIGQPPSSPAKSTKPNKYNAVRKDGYDSSGEADLAQIYKHQVIAGDIVGCIEQVKLPFAKVVTVDDDGKVTVKRSYLELDFMVIEQDLGGGRAIVRFDDFKGFLTATAKAKLAALVAQGVAVNLVKK